ncbi:(S)-benzoin forming benzil reductase [Caldalkalibacillus mannanilyticus]|uniref:(S)-benzoin forming benzil reductase n=1 Tax=Caldalkalibacillus mannanilyticus TaxID=1418 RepID=UPI0004689FB9|nr:(S)-benzoin forming benzil reductase [Caldalkalibacillus mannanilyticus]
MKYFILTGTSRGLGEAMAKQLLKEDHHLICISRTLNQSLMQLADQRGVALNYYPFDLSQVEQLEEFMKDVFRTIPMEEIEAITLINNAGILTPVKPIEYCKSEEIIQNMNINLIAPMILTSAFVSHFLHLPVEKRVVTISSGAGKKPYFGWSSYCSAKAGVDLFTRCVGTEQEQQPYPVKMLSIAPGVVDTQMQVEIRSTQKEHFRDVDRFIALKEEGQLLSADQSAELVLKVMNEEQGQGMIVDIRSK